MQCPECGETLVKDIFWNFDPTSDWDYQTFMLCPGCGYEVEVDEDIDTTLNSMQ